MRTSVFEPIVRDLRAMPTDFGIVPYAKFDEKQENYYSNVKGDGLFIALPDITDTEFAGYLILPRNLKNSGAQSKRRFKNL